MAKGPIVTSSITPQLKARAATEPGRVASCIATKRGAASLHARFAARAGRVWHFLR